MAEARIAVRVTDEEKRILDLCRTAGPLEEPVSQSLLRLVEHARNGGSLLRRSAAEAMPEPPCFKVGDVVQLRSGGHLMSVIGIGDACDGSGETVTVMWSAASDVRGRDACGPMLPARNVPPACLKLADQDIPF